MESEITVRFDISYSELIDILISKGFSIKSEFVCIDKYLVRDDYDLNNSTYDILSNCVIVRELVDIRKEILYKIKNYDSDYNIINEGKVRCSIDNVDDAVNLFKTIGYSELINIYDKCTTVCNDSCEFIIQRVNDKYLFMEMEDSPRYILKHFDSVDELIKEFNKYNLPTSSNSYFEKKAYILVNEKLNR